MICGGMMSGNCAIGRARMATRPPSTVTIAITMATIGRLMKNRDICAPASSLPLLRGWRPRRLVHDRAVRRLCALDHHVFARPKAIVDDPSAAVAVADFHAPRDDVVVGIDDAHLIHALDLGDRALWNDHGVLDSLGLRADPRVL